MKELYLKTKTWLQVNRQEAVRLLVFVFVIFFVFISLVVFHDFTVRAVNVLLVIELVVIALVAYVFAAHAVLKALFTVGASLSLMTYLVDTYCALPESAKTANGAMKNLMVVALVYMTVEFIWQLYRESKKRVKNFKLIDSGRHWLLLIPFALFSGLLVWQIYEALSPIVLNFCVFKS